jgi:hypothetical protein
MPRDHVILVGGRKQDAVRGMAASGAQREGYFQSTANAELAGDDQSETKGQEP